MQGYLLQRLALVAFVLLGVSILVFAVTRLTPGDPARVMLGPRATEDQVAQLRTAYGLDQPLYVQYVTWLSRVVRGDLGESIQLHRPVLNEVAERFRGTLILAIAAMLIAFSLGIGIGVAAAARANTVLDRALMSLALLGISLPPFWVGLILIIIFTLLGLQAGWLLAGTVYIETVFAWPGLGSMLVNAILQRDYPLVQGGVLLVSTTYVLINLATDTLYLYLDPRLRHV